MRARGRAWRALWGAPLALIAQSCEFPAPRACALECGQQNACPVDFECQAASHLCVPIGMTTACSLRRESRPEQPEPDAGAPLSEGVGGASSDPGPSSGGAAGEIPGGAGGLPFLPSGGSSGAGGAPADGGLPAPTVNELTMSEAIDGSGCSGEPLSVQLQASGGVSPYAWRLLQAPPGVRLSDAAGAEVELEGRPSEAGSVIVELEDSAGSNVRSAEHVISESPRIAIEHLPSICTGEPYRAALLATGGHSAAYVWSAELVPAPGLPGSLEELGLALQGSELLAESSARLEEVAPVQVAFRVQNGECSSPELLLALDAVPGDSEECVRIGIVDPPPRDALPAPCLGSAYAESLRVEGGASPYLWQALSTPPGLHFDAESATLAGVAEGEGALVVEVSDANARIVQKSYEVQPRSECWLAYVDSEAAPARLELVDPRLLERQPDSARRQLPADVGIEGVLDFRFSPDGRFLAYRLGEDASSARLELAQVTDGEAHALDLGGAVATYAWSPDSATLAVAFTRAAQALLGGVDVQNGDALLETRAVASLPPELLWFDGDHLAYLAPDGELLEQRWLLTTRRAGSGFEPLRTHVDLAFSRGAQLLPSTGGVFVAEPETGLEQFFPSDGRPPIAYGPGVVVSPSGALAGGAREGALELFRGLDPSRGAPFSSAPGCAALLAWASGRERVACAGRDGELALFDVGAAADAIVALAPVRSAGLPDAVAASGRRRLFSPSGRWAVLASADNLFIVRADNPRPELWAALPSSVSSSAPGGLAFSPDETLLVIGAGNSLQLLDLEQGPESLRELSASALIDDTCSERFLDGSSQWCGSATEASVSWSRGSDLVAFRSALGTLEILDLSRVRAGEVGGPISPDETCSEACGSSSSARFQP